MAALASTRLEMCHTPKQTAEMNSSHLISNSRLFFRGFMAPEVLAEKMYRYEVDWYSFGATLWSVAKRRLPPK